ncbi:MAG: hypothetical protein H0U73_01095 [Tatlockia sp.]|nr:hypothetical protein [Tatlockia sp.]
MSKAIHVLIVEDSPIAQKVAKIQMVREGCEVFSLFWMRILYSCSAS